MSVGRVLIYGSKGALGSACVSLFKSKEYWVGSIDLRENKDADLSIIVPPESDWTQQEQLVLEKVGSALDGEKLDAVICVAGGWVGGHAKKDLARNADSMWRQSVWTSTISATLAAHFLKEGGVLALTGAKAALSSTPGMIGYGMAKSAVHHLTRSLADKDSGLPKNAVVFCILPVTLDTPMNRKWMPNSDFTTWTPTDEIAQLFVKWTQGLERPISGALLQLETTNSVTSIAPVLN